MLNKTQKSVIAQDLAGKLTRQKITVFSDFSGISVVKSQELRRALKKGNAEYRVAKKTLFDRVLDDAGLPIKTKNMQGEIGAAFGYGDEASLAKILAKFGRENETFKILGGILGSRALTAAEVLTLSRLPSRKALLTQVVAVMVAPLRGLAVALQGNIRNLAYALSQVRDNKINK